MPEIDVTTGPQKGVGAGFYGHDETSTTNAKPETKQEKQQSTQQPKPEVKKEEN